MSAHRFCRWLAGSLILFAAAPLLAATAALTDEPLTAAGAAPAVSAPADPDGGRRLSQLFYQLQVLQQEVQELRGLVEEQSYQLGRLARDQQEQYIDLDGRIAGLTTGTAAVAGTASGRRDPSAGAGGAAIATLPGVGAGTPETERAAYTRAFDLMKDRQFDASVAAFNQLIDDYPSGQYTANAFYWLGELYLAQTEAEQARQSFAQVLSLYPDHPKVADTLYKMGVVYHRLEDTSRAIAYFQQVQREYPDSSAAGLSARYMAELQ